LAYCTPGKESTFWTTLLPHELEGAGKGTGKVERGAFYGFQARNILKDQKYLTWKTDN